MIMKVSSNMDDSMIISFSCRRGAPQSCPRAAALTGSSGEAGEGGRQRFPRIPAQCENCWLPLMF